MTKLTVSDLRCEYLERPIGLDVEVPRLSWVLSADHGRGIEQAAYRILVAHDAADLHAGRGSRWDSGWVESPATSHVAYDGPPLTSGQRVYWTVSVRDDRGSTSSAEPSWWEAGLLGREAWAPASWIGARDIDVPHLRTAFVLDRTVRRARLYATALGLYRMSCNGARIGDTWLTPGWTDYARRIPYQAYDVTDLLVRDENVLTAVLANGWYAGYIGFQGQAEHYGQSPQLLALLVVEHDDGTTTTIASDASWRAAQGPLRATDMLMGERYDARRERPGWEHPGFDDSGCGLVDVCDGIPGELVGVRSPGVGVLAEFEPVTFPFSSESLVTVDFGQNMAGWVRLRMPDGPAGHRIRLRFGEVLGPHGELHTENLRGAQATDEYILSGAGEAIWEPNFTFHGFRYVEVMGWPGELSADDITAVACGSLLRDTGEFDCSSPMLRQLQSNIVWSQRSNFLEVPTDCPQRDERLGWLGDAQVFAATACFNQEVAPFFTKWMQDVVDAQSTEGGFPDVAPRVVDLADGMPGWGDAGVIVPWRVWQWYGDRRLLSRMLPACVAWIDFLDEANPDGRWMHRRGHDVGDWLAMDDGTPKDVIATAYFAHSADLVRRMAEVLGEEDVVAHVAGIAQRARDAFGRWYIADDGRVDGETQTAYVLALRFGLVPVPLRAAAARHLVAEIERWDGHLSVGFLGVEHLLPVLTETGYLDLAYDLALQDTVPSFGYAVRHGATTIWERWDGWTEEAGLQNPAMNSFNHYAYGSIGTWLYTTMAGIAVDGERRFLLAPQPGPGIDWARATYQSLWGQVGCSWSRVGNGLALDVTVPTNTSARLVVPFVAGQRVREADVAIEDVAGVRAVAAEKQRVTVELGSGRYELVVG